MNSSPTHIPAVARPSRQTSCRAGIWSDLGWGLGIWLTTSFVILGSGWFGSNYLVPTGYPSTSAIDAYGKWDGGWYASVIDRGYSYSPSEGSNVVFFPAYPLLSGAVQELAGCSTKLALLLVAQACLAIGFVVFRSYLRLRFAMAIPSFATVALVLFSLFPPTFFFRVCYSEAMFFCLTALTLLAIERRAPLLLLALLVGLATATRPVGVGLTLIVLFETWRRSASWKQALLRGAGLLPLSLWGLLAYCGYLYDRFDEPLAFAKAQEHWNCHPGEPLSEKVVALLELKPIWGSFVRDSGHFVGSDIDLLGAALGASGINALVFIFGLLMIVVGAWRRWLNAAEVLTALVLLGIPYLTRGFESQFLSFARFTSAAIPIYIPMTMIFLRLPRFVQFAVLLIFAWTINLLTALFTAGYHLI